MVRFSYNLVVVKVKFNSFDFSQAGQRIGLSTYKAR